MNKKFHFLNVLKTVVTDEQLSIFLVTLETMNWKVFYFTVHYIERYKFQLSKQILKILLVKQGFIDTVLNSLEDRQISINIYYGSCMSNCSVKYNHSCPCCFSIIDEYFELMQIHNPVISIYRIFQKLIIYGGEWICSFLVNNKYARNIFITSFLENVYMPVIESWFIYYLTDEEIYYFARYSVSHLANILNIYSNLKLRMINFLLTDIDYSPLFYHYLRQLPELDMLLKTTKTHQEALLKYKKSSKVIEKFYKSIFYKK